MESDAKIFVAGHNGMVGGAIVRSLLSKGYQNIICKGRSELDLENREAVLDFFQENKPKYVFLAAAKVGGIVSNQRYPVEFLTQNLMIQNNVIMSAYQADCKKLLFLGSSCIYPRDAEQPISETALLTGPLEETNKAYAIAKIAGVTLCNSLRTQNNFDAFTVMPSNVYGIGDNFHPENSHVVAGLMRRIHDAKQTGAQSVDIWGTGKPLRELIFSEDLGDACTFLMQKYTDGGMVNAGSDVEFAITEIAEKIARVIGYEGDLRFDKSKPDGTPRKIMNNDIIKKMGWSSHTDLLDGLTKMYEYYLEMY